MSLRIASVVEITLAPVGAPMLEAYLAKLSCGHFVATRRLPSCAAFLYFGRVRQCNGCLARDV